MHEENALSTFFWGSRPPSIHSMMYTKEKPTTEYLISTFAASSSILLWNYWGFERFFNSVSYNGARSNVWVDECVKVTELWKIDDIQLQEQLFCEQWVALGSWYFEKAPPGCPPFKHLNIWWEIGFVRFWNQLGLICECKDIHILSKIAVPQKYNKFPVFPNEFSQSWSCWIFFLHSKLEENERWDIAAGKGLSHVHFAEKK